VNTLCSLLSPSRKTKFLVLGIKVTSQLYLMDILLKLYILWAKWVIFKCLYFVKNKVQNKSQELNFRYIKSVLHCTSGKDLKA